MFVTILLVIELIMYAPIVLFAFNRLEPLKACVSSLLHNREASDTDLVVFVDGPRAFKEDEVKKVKTVREYVKSITGFKSLETHFSGENKGLAPSVISGVTEVINRYGKVIVVEDDLYLAPSFLGYMNTMLDAYEKDERVMQVSGYSSLIRHPERYHCDHYFSRRAHSWSWATWKDRWDTIDWEVKDYDELAASKEKQRAFCEYGSDLFGMLKGWHDGRNSSWAVRFMYSMHKQGRFTVSPIRSLVRNDGFGLDATNCQSYDRYKIDFDLDLKTEWDVLPHKEWNKNLNKEAVRYWSIPYRIYGKIMTYITK